MDLQNSLHSCNVCFDKIQTYGLINCGHIYCFNCILSWSKKTNTCPLCKSTFNVIKKIDGTNTDFINVDDRQLESEEEEFDPFIFGILKSK